MLTRISRIHQYSARNAIYPVLFATLLACGLLVGRFCLSGRLLFMFLVWNLFLAWIPFLGSLWVTRLYHRRPQRWLLLMIPGLVWLLFFPNAPYIVTDFLHLRPRSGIPVWYDVALLAAFAWAGLFLAVFSLRAMQSVVRAALGPVTGWLFVGAVLGLGGLGVYVGRFLRWNSWDLLLQPRAVLADIGTRLIDPLSHPGPFGVTIIFASFLFVCYLAITAQPSQGTPGQQS